MSVAKRTIIHHRRTWREPHAHRCPGRVRSASQAPPHPSTFDPQATAPGAHPLTCARPVSSASPRAPPPRLPWHPSAWTNCTGACAWQFVAWEDAAAPAATSLNWETWDDLTTALSRCATQCATSDHHEAAREMLPCLRLWADRPPAGALHTAPRHQKVHVRGHTAHAEGWRTPRPKCS